MALKLGWTPGDWRESFWKYDPSIGWDDTDEESRKAYDTDGERAHLKLTNGKSEPPTLIRFRALRSDERATVIGLSLAGVDPDHATATWARLLYWAFRVGVELPGMSEAKHVRECGVSVLPRPVCDALAANYGDGLWQLYGGLVWGAANLTEDEKKALSSG